MTSRIKKHLSSDDDETLPLISPSGGREEGRVDPESGTNTAGVESSSLRHRKVVPDSSSADAGAGAAFKPAAPFRPILAEQRWREEDPAFIPEQVREGVTDSVLLQYYFKKKTNSVNSLV